MVINIHPELLSSNDGFYQRHWVVLESKLQLDDGLNNDVTPQTPLDSLVKLTMFSWGNTDSKLLKNTRLKYF